MGVLGWDPDVFWCATPIEFNAALEGWEEREGKNTKKNTPADVDRLRDFMASRKEDKGADRIIKKFLERRKQYGSIRKHSRNNKR